MNYSWQFCVMENENINQSKRHEWSYLMLSAAATLCLLAMNHFHVITVSTQLIWSPVLVVGLLAYGDALLPQLFIQPFLMFQKLFRRFKNA